MKLEIGVGRLWMRRALTVTFWPTASGFARCSGKVREASSSQLLPSAPSRSGVAGIGPSIGMRTRRRSVAPGELQFLHDARADGREAAPAPRRS